MSGEDNNLDVSTEFDNQIDTGFSDEQVVLEDYDEYPMVDLEEESPEVSNEYEPTDEEENPIDYDADSEQEEEQSSGLNFDDDNFYEEEDQEDEPLDSNLNNLTDEQLEKVLRDRGYVVEKSEQASAEVELTNEIKMNKSIISNIDELLNKGDEFIMRTKLRSDIAQKYKKENRDSEINSDEFNEDVEMEFEDLMNQPGYLKDSFLQAAKNGLLQYKGQIESKLEKAENDLNQKYDAIATQNKNELKKGLNGLYENKRFLGQQLSEDIMKKVYNNVITYKVSNRLNNNQAEIAEIALYLEMKDRGLLRFSKGASYGEGVRDAVNAYKNGQTPTSKSPLTDSIESGKRKNNAGVDTLDIASYWGPEIVEDQKDNKPKYIAGKVR